jgi:preprotein translocase SecE subunit
MGSEENPNKHRLLKRSTTVRERVQQAASSEEPRRLQKGRRRLATPFKFVGRKIAKVSKRLGKFKILRIIGYIFVPPYFRNSYKELRQVTWPNRRETLQLVLAVVLFAIVFGVAVAVIDYGLDKLFKQVLLK